MDEPLLEAQSHAEICPLFFVSLACFLSLKCHWYENAIFLCSLHLKCPLCHSPLATPCTSLKALCHSSCTACHTPCKPTATGEIYSGNDRVLCHSLALLLCRGPDTEPFFCTADAALGHIWSASGSLRPPGPGWGHLACKGLLSGRWSANQASVTLN